MRAAKPLLLALVLVTPGLASAQECRSRLAPSPSSVRETGLDEMRSACPSSGYRVHVRADATIDRPHFYGTLGAALLVSYQHLFAQRLSVELGTRLLDYRFAQNAVIKADEWTVGPAFFAAAAINRSMLRGVPVWWSPMLRFNVPRSSNYDATLLEGIASLTATAQLQATWAVHARVFALGAWNFDAPQSAHRQAAGIGSDLAWGAADWLGITIGAEVQGGYYRAGVDHVLVRAGAHFTLARNLNLDVSLALPNLLPGEERSDAIVHLGITVR